MKKNTIKKLRESINALDNECFICGKRFKLDKKTWKRIAHKHEIRLYYAIKTINKSMNQILGWRSEANK